MSYGGHPDPKNFNNIPKHLFSALKAYAESGRRTGDCLKTIIANDFMEAMGRADPETVAAFPAIACYIYMEFPAPSHGSYGCYQAWSEYKCFEFEAGENPTPEQKTKLRELRKATNTAKEEATKEKSKWL